MLGREQVNRCIINIEKKKGVLRETTSLLSVFFLMVFLTTK